MNPLGSTKEIVSNKLIIMYVMNRLDIPVSNGAITRLVLETRLMNYFMLQQCLNELNESKHISLINDEKSTQKAEAQPADKAFKESHGNYVLTDSGKKTLQYFISKISPGIRKQLDDIIPAARREIEDDLLITADYVPESESKYTVICKMREKGFPLIELKAAVGTKKDALEVCENWKKHSAAIYAEIIGSLTKQR
jgi:hypothetical protein